MEFQIRRAALKTQPHYSPEKRALVVCAWCWPYDAWKQEFPELAALNLPTTHGMCPECARTFEEAAAAEIAACKV